MERLFYLTEVLVIGITLGTHGSAFQLDVF